VRLTPAGRADRFEGAATDSGGQAFLKVRVRAAAQEGAANAALETLLAKLLSTARSRVRVVRGGKARLKIVAVEGLDRETIARRLAAAETGS
jgi:uncharacterized protein YggU (UPF0235/DUF167 family)